MSPLLLGLVVAQGSPAIVANMVVDEPRAVLAILKKKEESKLVEDSDWNALFSTEGYRRLKEREAGMKRPFTDDDFKKFVLGDDLAKRRAALEKTLDKWQKIDVAKCASRSLAYLPKDAKVHATVYPLIKPYTNSFVWDVEKAPAVMLYLDPDKSAESLDVTIAHEFHHIGYGSCCPSAEYSKWYEAQSKERQVALTWLRAFGEGFAVLAAAGGPHPHPVEVLGPKVQAAWETGEVHLADDSAKVEQFFLDVLHGKLNEDAAAEKASDFYDIVGPWYTVGYEMAVTIERAYGRKKLIECYLDPRKLLPLYNAAAKKTGGKFLWSPELLKEMGCEGQG